MFSCPVSYSFFLQQMCLQGNLANTKVRCMALHFGVIYPLGLMALRVWATLPPFPPPLDHPVAFSGRWIFVHNQVMGTQKSTSIIQLALSIYGLVKIMPVAVSALITCAFQHQHRQKKITNINIFKNKWVFKVFVG